MTEDEVVRGAEGLADFAPRNIAYPHGGTRQWRVQGWRTSTPREVTYLQRRKEPNHSKCMEPGLSSEP